MLEQRPFTDDYGHAWLNRPGPERGISAKTLLLLSLIPGQMIRLPLGAPWWVGVLISMVIGGLLLLVCLIVEVGWSLNNQTCPHCHTTKWKGYTQCSGCGYPYSWSSSTPAPLRRPNRQKV